MSIYLGSCDITYPSGTSLLYSSLATSNFNFAFSVSCCASSFDNPTKLGTCTSAGFVRFSIPSVPPNAIINNSINPINMLNFL